jgi:hypothetical protein
MSLHNREIMAKPASPGRKTGGCRKITNGRGIGLECLLFRLLSNFKIIRKNAHV